jgi:hypothetical protein
MMDLSSYKYKSPTPTSNLYVTQILADFFKTNKHTETLITI